MKKGKKVLAGGQQRFGCDLEHFERLHEAASTGLRGLSADCSMGIAPHSLRATDPGQLQQLLDRFPDGPVHIHAAEQVREVEDVEAWLGARPVAWLLDNADVDRRWCLIHATQMDPAETVGLAKSGAVAGLCPITEANLGDGIFNAQSYLADDGRIGIGSDSNIRISLSEELRQLEYSQRLKHRARNVLADDAASTGENLFKRVAAGTAQAIGRNSGALEEGRLADIVAIDAGGLAFSGLTEKQLLDGWIFAADDSVVTDLWSAGRHCVKNGHHLKRDSVERRYREVLCQLVDQI